MINTKGQWLGALAVVVAVAAVATFQYHNTQGLKQANGCLQIYLDQLTEDAKVTDFTIENQKISVEYESAWGKGKITCEATEEGLLDDVATLNQKFDALWDDTPMPVTR